MYKVRILAGVMLIAAITLLSGCHPGLTGEWHRQASAHGDHSHLTLWINIGDKKERPVSWDGEIRFELIDDHGHDHDK